MPADRRARPILGHKRLLEAIARHAGKGRGAVTQWQEKGRDRLGLFETAAIVIVARPERHDAALAEEAVKLEFLERQVGKRGDQARLLVRFDRVGRVTEAIGIGAGDGRGRAARVSLSCFLAPINVGRSADKYCFGTVAPT